ncbi:hypothetical protein C8Q75DRAFT_751628 [Abortiporus biennis]|nr:hypothetical protein C8Q75DRAFT_751628 [Abortiporus biennis]
MATRIHTHSPLPAPALHASVVTNQSKSTVLAGVQDAYWSDDEAEDAECPLCLEEMDISDLNFKPCPCGYQICRFCWHHIKENLNGRCPACRREYTDEAVQFKPINKEDHKRLTQQKKQRERERKELDALNRRHLANVRVVQRNVVYVVGIGPRFAKEELIPTLRTNEYFGQYGKISKIVITKRNPPGGRAPVVGLYITYHRREDAARCIAAVDGAPSPGGGHEIMRASYGTTKYCMAFLRGVNCSDHSCMNLHEWGDENDCFTKEDLTTLKHTMRDTENRPRTTTVTRKADEVDAGLPRGASWGSRSAGLASTTLHNNTSSVHSLPSTRQPRRTAPTTSISTRQHRSGSTAGTVPEPKVITRERKVVTSTSTKTPSQASSSRPSTPASASLPNRPTTPSGAKASKVKEPPIPALPPSASRSPTVSTTVGSDVTSVPAELSPPVSSPEPVKVPIPTKTIPAVPPGIPAVPPGLTPPPGLPHPARVPASTTSSPLVVHQTSQGPYQMSNAALALVEDIRARRESSQIAVGPSPFPEFDRMFQALSGGDSGFSFSLDPKLAGDDQETMTLPDLDVDATTPFTGTFLDAFPALTTSAHSSPSLNFMPPPGLGYPPARSGYESGLKSPALERQSTGSSSYTGSFNPFASETSDEPPARRYSPFDEERKMSRFGFARGRQGSSSSPLHAPSPLSHSDNVSQSAYYNTSAEFSSASAHAQAQWGYSNRGDYMQSNSAMSSPLAQHAQAAQMSYMHQQPQTSSRFQPFDNGVSEAQLRDLLASSRMNVQRSGPPDPSPYKFSPNQPFNDPAIMSAGMMQQQQQQQQQARDLGYGSPSSSMDNFQAQQHLVYGPPPGLSYPPGIIPSPHLNRQLQTGGPTGLDVSQTTGAAHASTNASPATSSPILSSSDFPALTSSTTRDSSAASTDKQISEPPSSAPTPPVDSEKQAKAEKKAAKKAAAAERAAERRRIAEEKAAVRAAEKERVAQEKAMEKEKAAALKAEMDKAAKEKAEQDRITRLKVEQERAEAEKERLDKEKEKARKENDTEEKKVNVKGGKQTGKGAKNPPSTPSTPAPPTPKGKRQGKGNQAPIIAPSEPVTQAPILAKMPKKNKPITKPIKIPKDDHHHNDSQSNLASAAASETPQLPDRATDTASTNNSRSQSIDRMVNGDPASLEDLFAEIDTQVPWMHVSKHPFFDTSKINPAAKMPLEYGPLVHALSALSVGGGSFANNMPSGSIDNAVSSFQQLLETLTQTISDLLRLLPRTTWDDSSSFDGVLRDMLKGDDFLDDGGEEHSGGHGKEDEVAALTMALERRARWMEVQLSKLEELHRDINTAAVRAILSFNDNGWDNRGGAGIGKVGNSLQRFDQMGFLEEKKGMKRVMTADELEKKLIVAREAAQFAEAELREAMQRMQQERPESEDDW